jgi:hypothetical protein
VTPLTETGPQISLSGDILTSTADSGNQWYLNDSLLPGKTGVTDTVAFSGVYYTVVTDPTTGCVLTSNKITYTSDGINLKYGPNPTGGQPLNLTFQVKTAANTSVELYNTLGERVYEAQYPDFSGIFNQKISLNYLSSGIYVMKIIIGSATYHEKILVTKK